MAKEKIGVLGGSFDPIHQGHIQMALSALEYAGLDRVLMVPSGNPPYRDIIADKTSRWHMTVAACTQNEKLVPCRMELDCEGPTYTADTLAALKKEYPKASLYYIIGADQLMILDRWQRCDEVFARCTFLVCPRAIEATPSEYKTQLALLREKGARIRMVPGATVPVSSGILRTALAEGKPTPQLFISVREYCLCKGLYGVPMRVPESPEWLDRLFSTLTPKRFSHTLAVAHTARRLARIHGLDKLKAEQAGLLHDCAKCLPLKEMQLIARTHSLTTDSTVLGSGSLLHSLVGAWVARNHYGMADPEVLQAIMNHTTGRAGMSQLDICVFIADSIEPTRSSYPDLDKIRMLADLSLERAIYVSLERTAAYVSSKGKYLHPSTMTTLAWFRSQTGNKSSWKDDSIK